jgi:hypothetical protein
MTQHQLDRALVRSTGESLRTLRRLGFGLSGPAALEPEDLILAVDCPFCGRSCRLPGGPGELSPMAECDPCDVYFDLRPDDVIRRRVGLGRHLIPTLPRDDPSATRGAGRLRLLVQEPRS